MTLAYLSKKWSERKTPNSLVMWCDGDRGWVGDTNNDNFQAGIRSVGSVLSGCVLFFGDGETETVLGETEGHPSSSLPLACLYI